MSLALGVVAALLLVQVLLSRRQEVPWRVLSCFQAAFWALAFLGRPIYYITFRPDATDPLYDYRLYSDNYSRLIVKDLWIFAAGEASYLLMTYALLVIFEKRNTRGTGEAGREGTHLLPVLTCLAAFTWVGRIMALSQGGGLSTVLIAFGSPVMAGLTIALRFRQRSSYLCIAVIAGSELTWAILSASKTPLFALLLALCLRLMLSRGPRATRRALPFMLATVIAIFVLIQPLKHITTTGAAASRHGPVGSVAASVLARTDMIQAITDAAVYPDSPWLTSGNYVKYMASGLVPKFGFGDRSNTGLRWTREVRAATVPNQYKNVSLATGVQAEGYVELGYFGAAAESAVLAVIAFLVSRSIARRRDLGFIAASVVFFDSSMYEGGLLSIAECGATVLEVLAVAYACRLMIGAMNSRSRVHGHLPVASVFVDRGEDSRSRPVSK